MLRNILFVVAGLIIFVCGSILGPKMWDSMQKSTKHAEVKTEQASQKPLDQQDESVVASSEPVQKPSEEEKPKVDLPKDDEQKADAPQDETLKQDEAKIAEDKQEEKAADADAVKSTKESAKEEEVAKEDAPQNEDTLLAEQKKEEKVGPQLEESLPKKDIIKEAIQKGDTLSDIFKKYTDEQSVYELVNVITKQHSASKFILDHRYIVVHDTEKNKIERFEYEINDTDTLILDNTGEKPEVSITKIVFEKKLAFIKGTIKENPYNTIKELNEDPDKLSYTLMSMFKWDIDFNSEIQVGDSFSVLVEKLYHEGEFKGYGRSIGGTFTNKNKTIESFLYYDANKNEKHYNAKGENMQRFLLRTPLDVIRVTSGFSYRRRHPVYGTYRPHLGLDYGAPSGTRIFAIADGVVTYVGWRGGFGKHITIKHATGLESMYSHLRGYARGIRRGAKVKQGKVIGYVGSTGVSTGPHLDFRLKQNGKYINPHATKMNRRAASVSKVHKQGYEERKKLIREFMDGTRSLESYDPKMVDVPGKKS